MGLLSLDSLKLRVKLLVGTESEKLAANRCEPLNFLLIVTITI